MTDNETTKTMKAKITHFLYMAAVVLLTACSQDDDMPTVVPPQDNGKPLTFTITDGGFSAGGNSGTRAAEEGYKTNFTAGDACGLYIVRNGEVKNANVKLTATQDGESIVWTMDEKVKGETTDSYYLYYPYQADMDNKVSAAAGADDKAFFGNLISGWEVTADQSEYADYTASDLMTATGEPTETEGTISLTFSTVHRMALAVIEMPKATYHFTNTSPEISDYVVYNPNDLTVTFSEPAIPYKAEESVYRYIINPANALAITGSYKLYWENSDKYHNFTIHSDKLNAIAAGKGKKFKIDGGIREISHNLQLGDYLCKDGTLISKETTLTNDQKNNVAAIVFYAGHNDYDTYVYNSTAIEQKKCHGYAVALKDVVNGGYSTCIWGKTGDIGCHVDNNKTHPEKDWNGFIYSNTFWAYASGGLESSYPATYFATMSYEETVPRPATCTSWFLPSIGQLKTICEQRNEIFKVLGTNLAYAFYWSSSEYYDAPGTEVLTFKNNGSQVYSKVKNGNADTDKCRVRAILAF